MQMAQLETNLAIAEDSVPELETTITNLQATIDASAITSRNLSDELAASQEARQKLAADLLLAEQQRDGAIAELIAMQEASAATQAQISKLSDNLERRNDEINRFNSQYNEAQHHLELCQTRLAASNRTSLAEISLLSSEIVHARMAIVVLRRDLDKSESRCADLDAQLTASRTELADHISKEQHQDSALAEAVQARLAEATAASERYEALMAQHARLEAEISSMTAELNRLNANNAELASELQHAISRHTAAQLEAEAMQQSLEQKLQCVYERNSSDEEAVRSREHQIDALRREISTLRSLVNQKDETASRLEATLNMTKAEAESKFRIEDA